MNLYEAIKKNSNLYSNAVSKAINYIRNEYNELDHEDAESLLYALENKSLSDKEKVDEALNVFSRYNEIGTDDRHFLLNILQVDKSDFNSKSDEPVSKSNVAKSKVTKSNSRKPEVAKALLYLVNEVNDGLGDVFALNEWAEVLADDYGLDFDGKDVNKVLLKALNIMSDEAFKDEVDNLVYSLFESGDLEYLRDTLHIYPRDRNKIIKYFNLIKPYASEPDKIDKVISELQGVNLDLRTIAEEFQSYLHNNYEPWTVLGTTSGPRTYVDLFNVPTDYDIVGADYFNYVGRPGDMLNHIGYGWKQDGDNIVADLIGFTDSAKGSSALYDQAPVSYGYSAVINSSNKDEKFKEMAEALIKKAGEIKRKYKLK